MTGMFDSFSDQVFDAFFEQSVSIFSTFTIIAVVMMVFSIIIAVLIPIMIGIFVYQDAKKHNMNAAMWTLIAVLAPSFIGLIIYLIIRSDYPMNRCSYCGMPIQKDYVRCPQCGSPFKKQCTTCGHLLEDSWSICPECGTTIIQSHEQPQKMQASVTTVPEKGIGKILIPIIILLLILLIVFAVILAVVFL